jgi:hypothetical protein
MSAYADSDIYYSDCENGCDDEEGDMHDFRAAAYSAQNSRAKQALTKCRNHSKKVEAELERLKGDDEWTLAALVNERRQKKEAEERVGVFKRRANEAKERVAYLQKNCNQ